MARKNLEQISCQMENDGRVGGLALVNENYYSMKPEKRNNISTSIIYYGDLIAIWS